MKTFLSRFYSGSYFLNSRLNFRFLLFILSLITAGCASIGRDQQQVAIITSTPGASIYYKDRFVSETPGFVALDRSKDSIVEIRQGDRSEQIKVNGEYRWGRSFFGNFAFLSFAPVGWVTDLITGDAYSFPKKIEVDWQSKMARETSRTIRVAIAPPHTVHANISDEIGHQLTTLLKNKLGANYVVSDFGQTRKIFDNENVDYKSEITSENEAEIYGRLRVDQIYFSDVTIENEKIEINGQLKDFFNAKNNQNINFEMARASLTSSQDMLWSNVSPQLFYWLPNAIAIDLNESHTTLVSNGTEYEAKSSQTDDFLGDVSKYVGAIGIRRIEPPLHRPGWHYRFALVPTASFSYTKEEFPNYELVKDVDFTRLSLTAGYGPSLNYGNPKWNLFFNIYPVLAYTQIKATSQSSTETASETKVKAGIELGALYHITRNWNIRLFSRSVSVSEQLWESIIEKTTGAPSALDDSPNVATFGVSLAYILPNHIFSKDEDN